MFCLSTDSSSALAPISTPDHNEMKTKDPIRRAILWASAILASALLHGPLTLTLILVSLACGAIATDDGHVARGDCRRS